MLSASDALRFRVSLVDVGDGFDWRCADMSRSWWLDVSFLVDGVPFEPVGVWRESGRVSFRSCLRGRRVEAEGVCRPVVVACSAASWRLSVRVAVADSTALMDVARSQVVRGERSGEALLSGLSWSLTRDCVTSGDVMVRLPFGRSGAFVGSGVVGPSPDTDAILVSLDEGSARYVLA